MKLLRDVRYWINHVLPPDQRRVVPEPGKKPSINEQLSWKIEGTKQREEQKRQQPRRQQEQQRERKIRQQQDIEVDHSLDGRHLLSGIDRVTEA